MDGTTTNDTEAMVALQGNIETFALQDVLRLLSSTRKTGVLRLEGSRGVGTLVVAEGLLVGGEATQAPHADGPGAVLFELLRYSEGDFIFDADAPAVATGGPLEVEAALADGEAQLDEWKGIEAVVPSLDHWVGLAPELPTDEVTIDRDRWSTLVAIAGGTSVGAVGDALSLGEFEVSRTVRDLVESGLVVIDEPRSAPTLASVPTYEAPPEPEPLGDPGPAFETPVDEPFDPSALVVEDPAPDAGFGSGFDAPVDAKPIDQSDATEIARQLANLSPKAAKAVAAAAKASTVEEREALLAEVDDEEDPINRDLLIKFLGSVNS